MPNLKKIIVLISGKGSNLKVILEACADKKLPAEVVAVITNNPEAKGLEHAQKFQVPNIIKVKSPLQSRNDYDSELAKLVTSYQPDLIILAGWMRVLSHEFLQHFPNRVINLHPALPGMFPGTKAIERAFNAFQQGEIKTTGVMVHFVPDEGVDSGPVIDQAIVAIYPEDTLTTLTTRIHETEHRLLISSLQGLLY